MDGDDEEGEGGEAEEEEAAVQAGEHDAGQVMILRLPIQSLGSAKK